MAALRKKNIFNFLLTIKTKNMDFYKSNFLNFVYRTNGAFYRICNVTLRYL